MWLFRFLLEFSEKFSQNIHFLASSKDEEKIGEYLLFVFVLLNRGIPDVKTILYR